MAPADTKRIRPVTYSPPFHLAIPVDDLAAADQFYHGLLGCPHGRRSDKWIDYDFFGHQLVAHLSPADCAAARANFIVEPNIRFKGEPGEQGTFFIRDPAGNALEFKCFEDMAQLFAT